MLTKDMLWADQVTAVEKMLDFTRDAFSGRLHSSYFLLKGAAGTGKTSTAEVFLDELSPALKERTIICAPTNKAVKVARQLSGGKVKTSTIYKLLRLVPQANGEVKELKQAGGVEEALENISLVYCDEAGMVGQKEGPADPRGLRYHMDKAAAEYGIKFILAGDSYQLPPVGEPDGWAFRLDLPDSCKAELTAVKRHDNQILNMATHIREVIDGKTRLKIEDAFDDAGGVEVFRRRGPFESLICDLWKADGGQGEAGNRILAWRNDRVSGYNELVRETIYGRAVAREASFQVGERVVVCNPVKSLQDKEKTLMSTDEEGVITKIEVRPHPLFNEIECYALVVARDDGLGECGVFTPTPAGQTTANKLLRSLKEQALKDRVYWGAFWNLHEYVNDVRPCHSITVHRSQGSTFKNVFVDVDDVLANRNYLDALRCLYVACTRPSVKLNLRFAG